MLTLVAFAGTWRARKLVNDHLAELASDFHLAPGRLPRMSEQPEANVFEAETVEEFLRRALDPSYEFTAKEWVDQDEPVAEKKGGLLKNVKREKTSRLPSRFEPPMARLHCTGCKNSWDAWITDDGKLQDARDGNCACDKGGYVTLAEE